MPSFIEKLALAFIEYKSKTRSLKRDAQSALDHLKRPSSEISTATSFGYGDAKPGKAGRPSQGGNEQSDNSAKFRKDSLAVYLDWLNVQNPKNRLLQNLPTLNETVLLLRCEHWLEAADEHHRYGSNLRPYFDYWVTNVNNRIDEGDEEAAGDGDSGAWMDALLTDGRELAAQQSKAKQPPCSSSPAAQHEAATTPAGMPADQAAAAATAGPGRVAADAGNERSEVLASAAPGPNSTPLQAADLKPCTLQTVVKAKNKEPAGGWQKVLEAVAASTMMQRKSVGAKPRSAAGRKGGLTRSNSKPSITLQRKSGVRMVATSAPVTPKVSLTRTSSTPENDENGTPAVQVTPATAPPVRPKDADITPACDCMKSPEVPLRQNLANISESVPLLSPFGLPSIQFLGSQDERCCDKGTGDKGTWEQQGKEGMGQGYERCVRPLAGDQENASDGVCNMTCSTHQRWLVQSRSLRRVQSRTDDGGHDGDLRLFGDSDDDDASGSEPLALASMDEEGFYDVPEDLDRNNFFLWLDHGDGKALDLASQGVPREKLERERVIYLTPEQLSHYEVVVDKETGLLKYLLSGSILHTFGPDKDRSLGRTKDKDKSVGKDKDKEGSAVEKTKVGEKGTPKVEAATATVADGVVAQVLPHPLVESQGAKKWIWVVAPCGKLYVAPKIRGQFHHSSFLRGAVVMAAGNMVVDHGQLIKLTADSGHYWPQPDHFRWFFEHLSAQGADMTALKGLEFKTKH